MNPRVEEARIRKALRDCERRGYRVYEPMECVKEAIERFGDSLAVSCSFGSCSVVVLHMTLQLKPDVKVVFNNTGVEYPETYAYRDLLKKEWKLNLIETKPIKSFWQCIKEYGFPLYRGKKGKGKYGNPGKPIFLLVKWIEASNQKFPCNTGSLHAYCSLGRRSIEACGDQHSVG